MVQFSATKLSYIYRIICYSFCFAAQTSPEKDNPRLNANDNGYNSAQYNQQYSAFPHQVFHNNARSVRSVSGVSEHAHPTTLREHKSNTTARYNQPCLVGI